MCWALASLQSMLVIFQRQYCSGSSSSGGCTMQQAGPKEGNTSFFSWYSFWPVNRKLPRCKTEPCFLPKAWWASQGWERTLSELNHILAAFGGTLHLHEDWITSAPLVISALRKKVGFLGLTTPWAFETSHDAQCFSNFAIGEKGEIGTF